MEECRRLFSQRSSREFTGYCTCSTCSCSVPIMPMVYTQYRSARARDKRVCKNADAIQDRGGARADSPQRVRPAPRRVVSRSFIAWRYEDMLPRETLLMPVQLRPRTVSFSLTLSVVFLGLNISTYIYSEYPFWTLRSGADGSCCRCCTIPNSRAGVLFANVLLQQPSPETNHRTIHRLTQNTCKLHQFQNLILIFTKIILSIKLQTIENFQHPNKSNVSLLRQVQVHLVVYKGPNRG